MKIPEFNPLITEKLNLRSHIIRQLLIPRKYRRLLLIFTILCGTILGIIVPFFQRDFINSITIQHANQWNALWLLIFALVISIISLIIITTGRFFLYKEAVITERLLSYLIYQHAIKLSIASQSQKSVGDIVNLYAQDTGSITLMFEEIFVNILQSILSIMIAPIAIFFLVKIPIWPLFYPLIIISAILFILSLRQAKYFNLLKINAGARLTIVNEWLQNFRIIRILGWQSYFFTLIQQKRNIETKDRATMVTNGSTINSISQSTPLLVNAIGIMILLKFNNKILNAGEIFGMLWVFTLFLMKPLRGFAFAFSQLFDALTSAKRLEAFFNLETDSLIQKNKLSRISDHYHSAKENNNIIPISYLNIQQGASLNIKNLSLNINNNSILTNISVHIPQGSFVAVIGTVASGKTKFLQSLMRLVPAKFEKYDINQQNILNTDFNLLRQYFGYVPQECFIMSSSIKDNISFEYESNISSNYIQSALNYSELAFDLSILPDGHETQLGERGVNLSGGQKQRINLARSIFFDRSIVILDDSLSAVDPDTEEKLIKNLLSSRWKDKTRILSTHRMTVLKKVDKILLLDRGQLVANGTWAELIESSEIFKEFINKSIL